MTTRTDRLAATLIPVAAVFQQLCTCPAGSLQVIKSVRGYCGTAASVYLSIDLGGAGTTRLSFAKVVVGADSVFAFDPMWLVMDASDRLDVLFTTRDATSCIIVSGATLPVP